MRRMLPLFTALSLSVATPLQAETLEMPAATEAPGYSVNLPGRGMNMTQVEEKFGPPMEKLPEVGDPPIIRWIYPDYTVYFEYQYVINSVLNDLSIPTPQPMPTKSMAPAEMPSPGEVMMEPTAAEMPPPGGDPVEISPEVEIIPAPEESSDTVIEAPPEVYEPEAEVVIPATPAE